MALRGPKCWAFAFIQDVCKTESFLSSSDFQLPLNLSLSLSFISFARRAAIRDREETRCCCAKCGPCMGTIYSECNCRHQARGWQNRGAVERERLRLSRASPPLSSLKPNHVALCITVRFTDFSPGLCWGWGFFSSPRLSRSAFVPHPPQASRKGLNLWSPARNKS